MKSHFDDESYLAESTFAQITEVRVEDPSAIRREAARRRRRPRLSEDGRLVILAADHPGRGVTRVGEDPSAMGRRRRYLARILRVLTQPGVDGVMSTPDIIEELLILQHLGWNGEEGLLDDKLLIGCLNRGGIAGSRFEMRDRFGAFTADGLRRMRLDGAKMMFRLDLENPDSGATIHDCALALRQLEALDLPAFLEPLPVRLVDGRYKVQKTAREMIAVIGIAAALGNSSRLLWLKIPFAESYRQVVGATTCPVLMLGGESHGQPRRLLEDFASGLATGPNVRGVLVGRNILYPGSDDPGATAAAVSRLVHQRASVQEALDLLQQPLS